MLRRASLTAGLAALAAALVPAAAGAANYPPPGNPGTVKGHPKGRVTIRVCKHGKANFRTIQKAVNYAKRGDTIRVCDGTYREQVTITGGGKSYIKLVGNVKNPRRVVLEEQRKRQMGVYIFRANGVSVRGFYARHYNANGFFALQVRGYDFSHLVAGHGGVYGLYAFHSYGGTMTYDEAFYNNDSGFYIGETPPQSKPTRSFVRHVVAWGNVIGWSGTNMRYVTITKSAWFNNGLGIVPNALKSEKFPPPTDNVIQDNDIFWNNYDYFRGAPFKLRKGATGDIPYPVGTGVLLFGGQRNHVVGNRIFGNWLMGAGAIEQILLAGDKNPAYRAAAVLVGNEIRGNRYGAGGADTNGRDVFYDGSGRDNCVQETGTQNDMPADHSTWAPCPFSGTNAFDSAAQNEAVLWTAGDATHEAHWIRHAHPAAPIKLDGKAIKPLEHCTVVRHGEGCAGQPSY